MSKVYDKYLELKNVDNSKLYLFKNGKFYIFIADDCDLINEYVVLKKTKFTNEIYKCGFPENVLEEYLHVFKNHHLDVEIIKRFESDNKINVFQLLMDIDVDKLTPLEALVKLKEIQEIIINEKKC